MPPALRQIGGMLAVSAVVAAAVAAVWLLAAGGSYRLRLGLALMVVGALLALTGGTGLSRLGDLDARAHLGAGPSRDEPAPGGVLTGLGVFLFVALPLVLVGGLLHGRG